MVKINDSNKFVSSYNPKNVLDKLMKEGDAHSIKYQVKDLVITNLGPIKDLRINFKRYNLIIGDNATGKTTILHAIRDDASNEDGAKNQKSIIVDDISRLTEENQIRFIEHLKKSFSQIILTSRNLPKKGIEDFNIININPK